MVEIVAGRLGCGKWHTGKRVCVGVPAPTLVYESEVILLQTEGSAREVTAWMSEVDQSAERMVVSDNGKWTTLQAGTKPLNDANYSKASLFGDHVIALGLAEGTIGVGNYMLSITIALNKNSTDADTTGIRVNFCWCGGIKVPEDRW